MTNRSVSRKTAIVGIGSTPYAEMYRAPGESGTALQSALTATAAAIKDAGLRKSDIDGVMVGGLPNYESFMLRAGLTDVRFVAYYPRAGRLCPLALAQAAAAVESEMANYVVLFNAVEFRSAGRRFGESEDVVRSGRRPTAHMETSYGLAYGMSTPGANYALAYSRYKSEYGLADDALGAVAVTSGQWLTPPTTGSTSCMPTSKSRLIAHVSPTSSLHSPTVVMFVSRVTARHSAVNGFETLSSRASGQLRSMARAKPSFGQPTALCSSSRKPVEEATDVLNVPRSMPT